MEDKNDFIAAILTAGYVVNTRFEEENLDDLIKMYKDIRSKLGD